MCIIGALPCQSSYVSLSCQIPLVQKQQLCVCPFPTPKLLAFSSSLPHSPPPNVIINSTSIFSHQTLKEKSGIITHKGQLNL